MSCQLQAESALLTGEPVCACCHALSLELPPEPESVRRRCAACQRQICIDAVQLLDICQAAV